jgi:hypothetical protein
MSKFSEKREDEHSTATAAQAGPRWRWLAIVAVVAVSGWAAYYFLYYQKPVSTLDTFAQCLKSKGARMYGAWWCPHCAEQKEMFGFAFQYVNYVECSPEGQKIINDTCKQAGIKNFPTWQFGDGSRKEGTEPLAMLADKTGCRLP